EVSNWQSRLPVQPPPILPGNSAPLGVTLSDGGANFSLYSRHASAVELLLFDREEDHEPTSTLQLNPDANRTYHYWHAFVPGIRSGQLYAYRIAGEAGSPSGTYFDPSKCLLDPYGRSVLVPSGYSRPSACGAGKPDAPPMKNVVVDL